MLIYTKRIRLLGFITKTSGLSIYLFPTSLSLVCLAGGDKGITQPVSTTMLPLRNHMQINAQNDRFGVYTPYRQATTQLG
jgi:hypothetical protein